MRLQDHGDSSSIAIKLTVAWRCTCAGCNFDSSGKGTCLTGDCGGVLNCNGAGGDPPASLAEITLNGANGDDFYDISLVDGYNLPLSMTPSDGTGTCGAPGCTSNLNSNCPSALQVNNCASILLPLNCFASIQSRSIAQGQLSLRFSTKILRGSITRNEMCRCCQEAQ